MKIRLNENTQKNLRAFVANFGPVRIEKVQYNPGYYVYYPAESESYMHYCYSQDYLAGWLYGAVQCKNVFPVYKKAYEKEGQQ